MRAQSREVLLYFSVPGISFCKRETKSLMKHIILCLCDGLHVCECGCECVWVGSTVCAHVCACLNGYTCAYMYVYTIIEKK